MKRVKGYLCIAGAALLWGMFAAVVKFLFNKQFDPLIIVQTRVTIACSILFLFFLFKNSSLLIIAIKDIPLFLSLAEAQE